MLVIRKELKVGLTIGAAFLGVALVYGLMSLLAGGDSSKEQATGSEVANNDDSAGGVSDHGLHGAVSGLPPTGDEGMAASGATTGNTGTTAGTVADPFAENARADGNVADPWGAAFSTGRVTASAGPLRTSLPTHSNSISPVSGDVAAVSSGGLAPAGNGGVPSHGAASGGTAPTPANVGRYVVAVGDTFSSIAAKLYGDRNQYHYLLAANPSVDPLKLKPGMEISVPPADTIRNERGSLATPVKVGAIDASREYRVQAGDTLHGISQRLYGKSNQWAAIYDLNKSKIGPDAGRLKVGAVLSLPTPPAR